MGLRYDKPRKGQERILNLSQLCGYGYDTELFTNAYWLHNPCRYRANVGGRNTKKSTDMLGLEPLFKIMSNEYRNIVMIRQNDSDNLTSTYARLKGIIEELAIGDLFKVMVNPRQIVYRETGQKIMFKGFNNPTGITSVAVEHGVLSDAYMEEMYEMSDYDAFRKLDGSLRGELPPGVQIQITMAMNPWSRKHWVYEKMFAGRLDPSFEQLERNAYLDCYDRDFQLGFGRGLYLHQSTYRVNEFRTPEYDASMEYMRDHALEIYKVEGLGMWGNSTERVYPEFVHSRNIVSVEDVMRMRFRAFSIGIDTGLSNGEGHIRKDGRVKSATTVQLVGLTSDCQKIVAIDEWFHSNDGELKPMTQDEEVRACVNVIKHWQDVVWKGHPDLFNGRMIPVYIDCADIGFRDAFIKECGRQLLYRAQATGSTKMGIQTRVDFIRWLLGYGECQICGKCQNLIREMDESRRGDKGETRENLNDHALNAWEYAWTPLKAYLMAWGQFKQR